VKKLSYAVERCDAAKEHRDEVAPFHGSSQLNWLRRVRIPTMRFVNHTRHSAQPPSRLFGVNVVVLAAAPMSALPPRAIKPATRPDGRKGPKPAVSNSHYSMTSSAWASNIGGMSRPRERAVCKLMTNSNLVDCKTGRSAGLAPWRMLPAYMPTWRNVSVKIVQ